MRPEAIRRTDRSNCIFDLRANAMADENNKHTLESVAAKIVKALLKVRPTKEQKRGPREKEKARRSKEGFH